ncbi:rdgBbeta [Trypoxylus dichotomus]
MVLTKEYRICMPISVEEYKVGQLYMISRHSLEQSGDGEGVELVKNEACEDPVHGSGYFTEKRIHLSNRLPYWIQAIIPRIFYVTERAWNYYPFTITEYDCSFIPKFHITIQTRYQNNNGSTENCLNLTAEQLAERIVEHIDIAYDDLNPKHYKEEEDPRYFQSKKTHRGPLVDGWRNSISPIMCSYKLVNAYFEVWGLQTKVEDFIHSCIREVLLLGHRQAFAWIDDWYDMTYDDVKKYEMSLQMQTNLLLQKKNSIETAVEADSLAITGEDISSSEEITPIADSPAETPKSPVKKGYFSWF